MTRRRHRTTSKTGELSGAIAPEPARPDRPGLPRRSTRPAREAPTRSSAAGVAAATVATHSISRWLPVLLLVLLGIATYFNSFEGVFLFDDTMAIIDNPNIRQVWASLDEVTRPILFFSFAINYAAGGLNPWGYHFVNLCIHLVTGLVLFGIVRRMLMADDLRPRYGPASRWLALAVAAIWQVHPLQTESVTYVLQRAESLMSMFFVLTLYCAIRAGEPQRPLRWGVAAVAACALGMGTKEVTVMAPILVFLYDRMFVYTSIGEAFRRRWPLYAGLAATWLVLGTTLRYIGGPASLLEFAAKTNVATSGAPMTPWNYLLTQSEVIVHYLRLAVWPYPLILDYAWPVTDSFSSVAPYMAAMTALFAATIFALWKRAWPGYWGAWFFLILAPTSSIMPVADVAFEHRMYLPLAAVVAVVVIGGYDLGRIVARRLRIPAITLGLTEALLVLAVALALAYLSVRRNDDYRSVLAMSSDIVARRPYNPRAHMSLAFELNRAGRIEEAMRHYRESFRLKPDSPALHNSWGLALAEQGKHEEAVTHLKEVIRLAPDQSAGARGALGSSLVALGRYDEAVTVLTDAVRLQPNSAVLRAKLGEALHHQGRLDDAISNYLTAIRIDPNYAEAHNALGAAFVSQRRYKEAADEFSVAIRIAPRSPEAHNNMGNVLIAEGQVDAAVAQFSEAVRLVPGFSDGHYNLGVALLQKGDVQGALREYGEAVRLNPSNARARNNLGALLRQEGRTKEAVAQFTAALQIDPGFADARRNLQAADAGQ